MGFYVALPPAADITAFYLTYLNRYGIASLPGAFAAVARKVVADPTGEHLTTNNAFLLEQLLAPRVFGIPLELKADPDIRGAVNALLDALVNAGSAAAYLMRDDFATPLPPPG